MAWDESLGAWRGLRRGEPGGLAVEYHIYLIHREIQKLPISCFQQYKYACLKFCGLYSCYFPSLPFLSLFSWSVSRIIDHIKPWHLKVLPVATFQVCPRCRHKDMSFHDFSMHSLWCFQNEMTKRSSRRGLWWEVHGGHWWIWEGAELAGVPRRVKGQPGLIYIQPGQCFGTNTTYQSSSTTQSPSPCQDGEPGCADVQPERALQCELSGSQADPEVIWWYRETLWSQTWNAKLLVLLLTVSFYATFWGKTFLSLWSYGTERRIWFQWHWQTCRICMEPQNDCLAKSDKLHEFILQLMWPIKINLLSVFKSTISFHCMDYFVCEKLEIRAGNLKLILQQRQKIFSLNCSQKHYLPLHRHNFLEAGERLWW